MSVLGTLWVISAPSGGGKTSLVNTLLKELPFLKVSISHTTRSARQGEKEGKNYFFVDEEAFKIQQQQGLFLEYAKVFNHWYGTSKPWVMAQLQADQDVILEIDWQGARRIREQMPCLSIFILPPSRVTLENRLVDRQQDSQAVIAHRMALASEEISHYSEYDYLVVNDDFAVALLDLKCIIQANRLRVETQKLHCAALIASLVNKT